MDWDRLERSASAILHTFMRFDRVTDVNSLRSVHTQIHQGIAEDPSFERSFFQGLDVLELMGFVHRLEGASLELTSLGREAAAYSLEGIPLVNPNDPTLMQWAELEDLQEAVEADLPSGHTTFARLTVSDWRQFREVDISFHPRLTVLTGANAAGKTTLLNILAPHFSWNAQLLSASNGDEVHISPRVATAGQLVYTTGARTPVTQALGSGVNVSSLAFPSQQNVPGIFISSHRSISTYQPLPHLPTRFSESHVLLQQFQGEIQARYSGGSSQYPPLYRMKEALVSAAMFGYGNAAVKPNAEALQVWEEFQEVLRTFLPVDLHFERLLIQDGDIVVATLGGEFPLEAASGGLSAMLELSWQIYLRGRQSQAFTVCIDEPENHLHPELQRSIVPSLMNAFPDATFVLATHSPYVVTATPDAHVYALRPDESGRVNSARVTGLEASTTVDETLMSALGLDTALPIWAEKALSAALGRVPSNPTAQDLRSLRDQLMQLGLARQFPAAVQALEMAGGDD